MSEYLVSRRQTIHDFRAFEPYTFPCGTSTVTAASLCPTRDSSFHRMYFPANLSFSLHGWTVFGKEQHESLYRR
jgi:hypothetical protein